MNNRSKVTVAELIQQIQEDPNQAYQNLIQSGYYLNHNKATTFWKQFAEIDLPELQKQFPNGQSAFNKLVGLSLFHQLDKGLTAQKQAVVKEVVKLNPNPKDLTRSLFLVLELGDIMPTSFLIPSHSLTSLKAVKQVLKELTPKLREATTTNYTPELVDKLIQLVGIQMNLILIRGFVDAYLWSGLELLKKKEGKGLLLTVAPGSNKAQNLFILNRLKNEVKASYQRKEAHDEVSKEAHFQKNDREWKTNEGLATMFISSGEIVSQEPAGTTYLRVEGDMHDKMISNDPEEQKEGVGAAMLLMMEQNFHYQFRNALSSTYHPNDEINLHQLQIFVASDVSVSLYQLLCVLSCLTAKADGFRYVSDFPQGSVKEMKGTFLQLIKKDKPEFTEEQVEQAFFHNFVREFKEYERLYPFISAWATEEQLLGWFSKIEELKDLPKETRTAILQWLTDPETRLPFSPLYKAGNDYYFSWHTCKGVNLGRVAYDHYLSDKLFNPHLKTAKEKPLINQSQKARENRFTQSLQQLLLKVTPYAASQLDYEVSLESEDQNFRGEFDGIAWFEAENILMPIQVKLSNVSPRSEKRKAKWIEKRIYQSGKPQVNKDLTFLKTSAGLAFVAKALGLSKKQALINPQILPLLVTDNFFADHLAIPLSEQNTEVHCVSYFELQHLILNQKVHDEQNDWPAIEGEKAASKLIETIENNTFWQFLEPHAQHYNYAEALRISPEEWCIEMKL